MNTRPLTIRFWEKVNKNGPIPAHCSKLGRCWEWTACEDDKGYGLFQFSTKQCVKAHRGRRSLARIAAETTAQRMEHNPRRYGGTLPELRNRGMMIRKPQTRDTYHERGPTYHAARKLYLAYSLWPSATIAEILEVSRQARDLKDERARMFGPQWSVLTWKLSE
jgi:hypothetical protein